MGHSYTPAMRLMRCLFLVGFASFGSVVSGAIVMEALDGQERRRPFHPVVGLWSASADGEWTIDGANWTGKHTPEEIAAAGKALFSSPAESFVTNGTASGAFPLSVWTEAESFSSGTLSVDFKLVSGASDQTAGIVFNLKPTGDYLFVRYNTREGNVAIWGFGDGRRRVIARGDGKAQLPLGEWHTLTVTIDGTSVTGRAGELTMTHTLDAPASGRVGLWTKRDSVTSFRNYTAKTR